MRTTVPCRDLRNSERSSAALAIFAGSNYRSRFDDANAVFLSGRFLAGGTNSIIFPRSSRETPYDSSSELIRYVELLLLQTRLLSFLRFTQVYRIATASARRALPRLRRMEFGLVKGGWDAAELSGELLF
jgi:hypothetical protein